MFHINICILTDVGCRKLTPRNKRTAAATSTDVQNRNLTDDIVEETFVVDAAGNVVRK